MNTIPIHEVARIATVPFEIVEKLGISCGYERSFKIRQNRLSANRYMLGLETDSLSHEEIRWICHELQMPDAHQSAFLENVGRANLIFLGFEHDEPRCVYKVYLEFWDERCRELSDPTSGQESGILHVGFKWDPVERVMGPVASYRLHAELAANTMLERACRILGGSETEPSRAVCELMRRASVACSDFVPRYMECLEDTSSRTSFDINFYPSGLRLGEIQDVLARVFEHFAVRSDESARLAVLTRDKLLGHVSGGIDKQGEHFVTLYYEA